MVGMAIAIVHDAGAGRAVLRRLRADRARHRHRRLASARSIARRIPMTSMPQLVAAFHSLVGLAAVLVAAAAVYSPESFGVGIVGQIHTQALIEMCLGVAIGAITFTGSIIAFLKLDGRMSGKPIMLPVRHVVNAGDRDRARRAGRHAGRRRRATTVFWLIVHPVAGARRAASSSRSAARTCRSSCRC